MVWALWGGRHMHPKVLKNVKKWRKWVKTPSKKSKKNFRWTQNTFLYHKKSPKTDLDRPRIFFKNYFEFFLDFRCFRLQNLQKSEKFRSKNGRISVPKIQKFFCKKQTFFLALRNPFFEKKKWKKVF